MPVGCLCPQLLRFSVSHMTLYYSVPQCERSKLTHWFTARIHVWCSTILSYYKTYFFSFRLHKFCLISILHVISCILTLLLSFTLLRVFTYNDKYYYYAEHLARLNKHCQPECIHYSQFITPSWIDIQSSPQYCCSRDWRKNRRYWKRR